MIVIPDRPTATAEQARQVLTMHTQKRGIFVDLDRCLEYQAAFRRKTRPLYKELAELSGLPNLEPTQHEQFRKMLQLRFNVPAKKFTKEMQPEVECFDKEIVKALREDPSISDEVKRLLELRSFLLGYNHRISAMGQYINLPMCRAESFEGHRMVVAQPTWCILSTGRISAQEPSVQNLYRDMGDIFTYPSDFTIVRADSGQIEPRIIYSHFVRDPEIKHLIELYNDAYFGLIHFLLHALEKDKVELTDEQKEMRSQLKTMANAANYGSGMRAKKFDPVLSRAFVERIQNHPLRIQWAENVARDVANGADTFYSAFGTPITPDETARYKKGSYAWINHLKRCGVNNPVQATAGDLMNESVLESDRILRQEASGLSTIMMYKHDEGEWLVHDKDMHLADKLAGCMSYQVRDWIPIYSDMEIGKKHGIKNISDEDVSEE